MTLGAAGVEDPARTLMVVAGSRLGAAAFVIPVGGIDFLRTRRRLRAALGLGILSFVISHAVYLPATVGAWLAVPALGPPLERFAGALDLGLVQPGFLHALAGASVTALGPLRRLSPLPPRRTRASRLRVMSGLRADPIRGWAAAEAPRAPRRHATRPGRPGSLR